MMVLPFEIPISWKTANGMGIMAKRQLRLGAFMRPVSIHTGAWRYPGAWPDANFNFGHIKQLIRKLESGKFDALRGARSAAAESRANNSGFRVCPEPSLTTRRSKH